MKFKWFYSVCVVLLFFKVVPLTAASITLESEKKILIINSYSERVLWSKDLLNSLESTLNTLHPKWKIYSGHLKTESAVYTPAAALTLRSILWGYTERTSKVVNATNLKKRSLFVQDDLPDAIVWIGEEGFLHYLSYALQLGKWRDVPMVLCAVSDSVSAYGWFPERKFNFDLQYGIRDFEVLSRLLPADNPFIEVARKDTGIHLSKVSRRGVKLYQLDFKLNYSGNILSPLVGKNIALIHQLLPDLKELIWVDDDSYRNMHVCLEVENFMKKKMPDIKFRKMIHNRVNTDSIYNVMLRPAKGRAFLSNSWNIDALYSKRSDREIDSLFTHVSTVPLFSLTKRDFTKDNYWVGGCFPNNAEIINSSLTIIERAVREGRVSTLPFDTLSESQLLLNKTALERYGLAFRADKLASVSYTHIPPTFLHKYEKQLLVVMLVFVILACFILINWRHNRYNRRLQKDYVRYKRLYDKLQIIYDNSDLDFSLYNEEGQKLPRVVEEKMGLVREGNDLFFENLFESPCFSHQLKNKIRSKCAVSCEIAMDPAGKISRSNFTGYHVYQLIVKPLHDVEDKASRFMVVALNLTQTIIERQEKERLEGLFHFASDSSQVGVVFYDIKTATGRATESWCKNMNETFVSGTYPIYEQVVGKDRAALLKHQQLICTEQVQEPFCRDIQVKAKGGGKHWVRQHMYYMSSSNRLVELSLNIDEQKQNEKRLEKAKQKAEEANQETGRFLSSISHEVRTPLNAIVGFSTILAASTDKEVENEYASIILRNARLLDALITNILDLSALDGGKVSFCYTRLNIADLFLEMELYICNNLYSRPLQVIRELPDNEADRLIVTDQEYLRMLLWNLLSNALKFTESGSITLGCRKENKGFYFYITDTGCGVAPEDQKHIFDRFVKLDTYIQGTGLGLALCKSIAKHLNGEIGIISEKGKGSTFWFVLPDVKEN